MPRKAPEETKKTGEDKSPSVPVINETTGGRLLFGGDGKYKKEVRWCSDIEPNERRTVETPVETLKRVVPREPSGFQYSGKEPSERRGVKAPVPRDARPSERRGAKAPVPRDARPSKPSGFQYSGEEPSER